MKNKGCTREFLYIRNSNPRLKLALLAEKCAAGMHVNTHSCPLRTEKLTKFHRFLSRLTLTSEGGEWIKKNPRRDFCHLICTWQGRRGWNKRILKQLNCYWQNQKQGSCFRCFFSRKLTIWEIFFTSFSEIQPSLLHAQHFLAFRIILPLLLLKLMTQIFWVSLWIFVFWGLTNSPPSDVKVNLGRNPWIMVNFWVLKGQLWVLTCIPAVHFSAISVNFSRGWLFLMYRNSCVHPLFMTL